MERRPRRNNEAEEEEHHQKVEEDSDSDQSFVPETNENNEDDDEDELEDLVEEEEENEHSHPQDNTQQSNFSDNRGRRGSRYGRGSYSRGRGGRNRGGGRNRTKKYIEQPQSGEQKQPQNQTEQKPVNKKYNDQKHTRKPRQFKEEQNEQQERGTTVPKRGKRGKRLVKKYIPVDEEPKAEEATNNTATSNTNVQSQQQNQQPKGYLKNRQQTGKDQKKDKRYSTLRKEKFQKESVNSNETKSSSAPQQADSQYVPYDYYTGMVLPQAPYPGGYPVMVVPQYVMAPFPPAGSYPPPYGQYVYPPYQKPTKKFDISQTKLNANAKAFTPSSAKVATEQTEKTEVNT